MDLKNAKNYSINIYNVQGQLINTFTNKDFNSNLIHINCENWSNGLYIVSISTDTCKYTSKLIKQ